MPNLDSIQPGSSKPQSSDETSIPIRRTSVAEESESSVEASELAEAPAEQTPDDPPDDPFEDEVKRPIEEMEEHTLGFVLKQAIYIIFQPKASFEDLREEHAIGRPMAVALFFALAILLTQLVLFYSLLTKFSNDNPLLQYLFPSLDRFRPTQLLFAVALLAVFWVTQTIGAWAVSVVITHFMAKFFGGRGSWSTFAVSALYWMIATSIVVLPLSVLISLILGSLSGWWFIGVILWIAIWIWVGAVLSKAVSVQYQLSGFRAIGAVFLPPLLLTFGFMVTSVLVPPLDGSSTAPDLSELQNRNVNLNLTPLANSSLATNAAVPSPSLQNNNVNSGALNTNVSPENTNDSLPGFFQVEQSTLEELTKLKSAELAKVKEVGTDQIRMEQLIEIKYDLKLYYSVNQQYPISSGVEKLDGRKDIVNRSLEDFYGGRRSFVDPQYPSYYYSYESDGQTFQLTGFNVTDQEPITMTDKD